ncbi:MAG: hypothetical protein P1U39_05240 [Legionellaceae bacterium]|nr:hypothetical protein [Legionellaceae bacterium]
MGGCVHSKYVADGTLFRQRSVLRVEQPLRAFEQWIDDVSSLFNITIGDRHIDAVDQSLRHQYALPRDCLSSLNSYLEDLPYDFDLVARIEAVSHRYAQDLSMLAEEHQLIHHDLPHALEIELRTMNMLKYLNIWQTNSPIDAFFRASIACMLRLHDYEQKNQNLGTSNEEVTAERVMKWLHSALNLSSLDSDDARACVSVKKQALQHMLQLMASRIIVCGTTMIYSPTRILDLSELLFTLEGTTEQASNFMACESNQNLIQQINLAMILTGVNDKCPGASLLNVLMHLRQKRSVHATPMLDTFFSSTQFKAYYDMDRLREHYIAGNFSGEYSERRFFEVVNQQAFLLMIVPHVAMRTELQATTDAGRTTLRAFIQSCRSKALLDPALFKEVFDEVFAEHNLAHIMGGLFFGQIDREANFSRSLEGWLTAMAEKYLPSLGVTCPKTIYALIDPRVPEKDAMHLHELKLFYDRLTEAHKMILCQELMMTVVFQAGVMTALDLDLIELSEETSCCQPVL